MNVASRQVLSIESPGGRAQVSARQDASWTRRSDHALGAGLTEDPTKDKIEKIDGCDPQNQPDGRKVNARVRRDGPTNGIGSDGKQREDIQRVTDPNDVLRKLGSIADYVEGHSDANQEHNDTGQIERATSGENEPSRLARTRNRLTKPANVIEISAVVSRKEKSSNVAAWLKSATSLLPRRWTAPAP